MAFSEFNLVLKFPGMDNISSCSKQESYASFIFCNVNYVVIPKPSESFFVTFFSFSLIEAVSFVKSSFKSP